MATVKKFKKAQNGADTSDVPSWASKFRAQEITEMKNPKLAEQRRRKEDSTRNANYIKGRAEERAQKIKEGWKVIDRPSGSTVYVKQKNGGRIKKSAKTPAWTRSEGKSKSGGLNAKGRASYNRANPGKPGLKAPQPEGGSRKKSFCARMGGMKKKLTSSKTANDPNSRINKSLRKWKC